ncbi:MAG: radical SAM protein, partial [Anaerolineales bacterium]
REHNLLVPILLTGHQSSFEDDCACPESPGLLVTSPPTVPENDCACPMPSPAPRTTSRGALYRQADQVYVDERLPKGFRLLLSPYAPQGPSVANRAAWERWQAFAQPQSLSQPIDFQLAEQALLLPVNSPPPLPSMSPETLTVWLHITNACNLDCPYCYVRKSSARMSEEVGLQVVERVFQSAQQRGFRRIKLKYAGGEATLHFRLIRRLVTHAQALAKQSGLALDQVILSNGTLLRPEEIAWMLENRVRLMISLDGLGQIHDQMRPARDGKSSFARLSQTLENLLLPAGLIPNITLTVTRLNSAHIAETVRWVLERNLPLSLNFYRQPLGSPEELAAEEQALIEGMRAAYRIYETFLPETPFLNG